MFSIAMNCSTTSLYRSDRILGLAESELDAECYRRWGASLARIVSPGTLLVVTTDGREYSEDYKNALVDSLHDGGVHIIDFGCLPSDLASYGAETVNAAGFVCVTGGTQPSGWTGLHWHLNHCPLSMTEQIERLRQEVPLPPPIDPGHSTSQYRRMDITYSWISWLQSIWYDTPHASFRILLDPLHGSWSGLARKCLQAIFPQMVFEAIHDEIRDDFGNLIPSSRCPASLETLCREVDLRRADLGVAFDADAGLFTVVDGHGIPLTSEELGWFFLHELLGDALKGEVFLHDIHCPDLIITEGIRLGGKPISVRRGDASFITAMNETNALIGLGSEGEIYFRGAQGNRIVLFAVCWLIDFLACHRTDLTTWRKTFPRFWVTPEFQTPPASLERIANRMFTTWAVKPEPTLEGIRFTVPGGRIDVRSIPDLSRTGFRFEAENQSELHKIVTRTAAVLEEVEGIGFFLDEQYEAQTVKRYYT